MEREQATKFMHDLLRLMLTKNGSDLFITAEFPPAFKIDGKVTPVPGTIEAFQKYLQLAPTGQFADGAKGMLQSMDAKVDTSFRNPNAPATKKKK